jgi:hypothetical protein
MAAQVVRVAPAAAAAEVVVLVSVLAVPVALAEQVVYT